MLTYDKSRVGEVLRHAGSLGACAGGGGVDTVCGADLFGCGRPCDPTAVPAVHVLREREVLQIQVIDRVRTFLPRSRDAYPRCRKPSRFHRCCVWLTCCERAVTSSSIRWSANCAEDRRDSTGAWADVPVGRSDKFQQFPETVGGASDQLIDKFMTILRRFDGFFAVITAFFGLLLTE